ncbi:MAG: hypothetical protein JKY65_33405 [Planctomycetes bacterium]|nr:hypothetical protein [Planctomycetota bacterium]
MDADLRRLERSAAEAPHDLERAADLARGYLRAGQPLEALTFARACEGSLHEEAAAALGAQLGLKLVRLSPSETYLHPRDRSEEVLVPAGAFLDEGLAASSSSLSPGGERSALARVELPAFLISTYSLPFPTREAAEKRLAREGDRLPTAAEWKKSWRGGLFLDGDALARVQNPEPDRLRPSGLSAGRGLERSPYGVVFLSAGGGHEWCADSSEWVCALADDGRYRVPPGRGLPPGARRVRVLDPCA